MRLYTISLLFFCSGIQGMTQNSSEVAKLWKAVETNNPQKVDAYFKTSLLKLEPTSLWFQQLIHRPLNHPAIYQRLYLEASIDVIREQNLARFEQFLVTDSLSFCSILDTRSVRYNCTPLEAATHLKIKHALLQMHFHRAIIQSDIKTLTECLNGGISINDLDPIKAMTALKKACLHGAAPEMIDFLIRHPEIDLTMPQHRTNHLIHALLYTYRPLSYVRRISTLLLQTHKLRIQERDHKKSLLCTLAQRDDADDAVDLAGMYIQAGAEIGRTGDIDLPVITIADIKNHRKLVNFLKNLPYYLAYE